MLRKRAVAGWLCVFVLAFGSAVAEEPDVKAAARGAVAKHGPAVVALKMVTATKVTYQGREMPSQEQETEVLGTVLDDTGLMVASNTAADPGGSEIARRPGLKIDSEVKSAKLIKKDGTELVLKIVLRDKELDLMFLRPEKADAKLANLGLKEKGPEPGLADSIVVLSRLGAVGDRQLAVAIANVQAVIDKPRRFYVIDLLGSMTALGCPVFTAKGELTGIVVMRVNQSSTAGGLLGGIGSQMLPAVLPVADVLEDMKQIEKP